MNFNGHGLQKAGYCFISICLVIGLLSCEKNTPSDSLPQAVAQVIGMGAAQTGNVYQVRSGSIVQLSAKDSNGIDDPILEFDWQQMDNSGYSVTLLERARNSKAFTAPLVDTETQLRFQLTITDADGHTAQDEVTVVVNPVKDVDHFLTKPEDKEYFYLFVSAPINRVLPETIDFNINTTLLISWTDKNGNPQSLRRPYVSFSDSFILDESFVNNRTPNTVVDTRNAFFKVPIYVLDVDDVNENFQNDNRNQRLEPELLATANVELEVTLTTESSVPLTVVVANQSDSDFSAVRAQNIVSQSRNLSVNNKEMQSQKTTIINTGNNQFSAMLNLENIRQALNLESVLSANQYYDCIDPLGQAATLDDWLIHSGFKDRNGNFIENNDAVHTLYTNNYDLGFGRDMWIRKDNAGNVYSYVINYPNLQNAIEKRGAFATVVMEYSPTPTGQCGDGTFSTTDKTVKFYAYVPDEVNGGMIRSATMNFDGRGERALPGVCLACHDGLFDAQVFNQTPLNTIPASHAHLNASFMPWDLDSFLYVDANNSDVIDPDYNPIDLIVSDEVYEREAQEPSFRAQNEMVLHTFADNPDRYETSIRLIHGWYGNENALPAVGETLSNTDVSVLTNLPQDARFNGSYILPGWANEPELYHDVFSRYCRLCHVQQDEPAIDFDSYAEFIENESLVNFVYEQGLMPLSRLTMDRFWLDFDGHTSAADLLKQHLNNDLISDNDVASNTIPGLPVASIWTSGESFTIDDRIQLDASGSFFAESFSWQLTTPNNSNSVLSSDVNQGSSFQADIPGGEYMIQLTVSNESGQMNTLERSIQIVDRIPIANCFSVATDSSNSFDVPIFLENLNNDGDHGLQIEAVNDENSLTFGTLSLIGPGRYQYTLSNPLNRGVDFFRYSLRDSDGDLSESGCANVDGYGDVSPGYGVVTIDSTPSGQLSPLNVRVNDALNDRTTTSIRLSWDLPLEGSPIRYDIFRHMGGSVFQKVGETTTRSFLDTGLQSNTVYNYQVVALTATEVSTPSANSSLIRTKVSYQNNILPSVANSVVITGVGTTTCSNCHSNNVVRTRLANSNFSCLTDDGDLGDCFSTAYPTGMGGLSITSAQRILINRWRADGTPE